MHHNQDYKEAINDAHLTIQEGEDEDEKEYKILRTFKSVREDFLSGKTRLDGNSLPLALQENISTNISAVVA